MKKIVLTIALLVATPVLAQGQNGVGQTCNRLTRSYMSTTTDEGQSFTPFRIPTQQNLSLTWGLAALDDAGTMLMQADGSLWGSETDGCRWTMISGDAVGIFRIAPGPDGYGYAWQDNGGDIFEIRHGAAANTRWQVTFHKGPINGMKGFAVDPADPLHLRTASDPGQIYESFDGGASWAVIGVAAMPGGHLGYVMAFDPNDLDHAVYGRVTDGGFVTFNGGQTWAPVSGLAAVPGSSVNLFNAVISAADGNTVYVAALDQSNGTKRHIYASTDGGVSFTPVLTDGVGGVFLQNSPVMEADRDNADLLRFIFSASPVFGGTFFYRYDLATQLLEVTANNEIPKVREIESSRLSPGALHVGFDFN